MTNRKEEREQDRAQIMQMHNDNKEILSNISDAIWGNYGKKIPGILQEVHDLKSWASWARWIIVTGGGIVIINAMQFFLAVYRGQPIH